MVGILYLASGHNFDWGSSISCSAHVVQERMLSINHVIFTHAVTIERQIAGKPKERDTVAERAKGKHGMEASARVSLGVVRAAALASICSHAF